MNVTLYPPLRPGTATLVDTLSANTVPAAELVLRYYGDNAPASAFKAVPHPRMIFKRLDTHTFVVLPDIPKNRPLWKVI